VEGQRKTPPKPVIIKEEEKFEVEKILNKRIVRGKEKFLVQWKGYTAEGDTWESRENLKNMKELVKEFKKEYEEECHESPKKGIVSQAFEHLIQNLKMYNGVEI